MGPCDGTISSNINEAIKAVLFFTKRFHKHKNAYERKKTKKDNVFMRLKTSKGKKVAYLLIYVFMFFYVLFVLFVCKTKKTAFLCAIKTSKRQTVACLTFCAFYAFYTRIKRLSESHLFAFCAFCAFCMYKKHLSESCLFGFCAFCAFCACV